MSSQGSPYRGTHKCTEMALDHALPLLPLPPWYSSYIALHIFMLMTYCKHSGHINFIGAHPMLLISSSVVAGKISLRDPMSLFFSFPHTLQPSILFSSMYTPVNSSFAPGYTQKIFFSCKAGSH